MEGSQRPGRLENSSDYHDREENGGQEQPHKLQTHHLNQHNNQAHRETHQGQAVQLSRK